MRHISLAAVLALLGLGLSLHAADWKPAPGPLMTRWAKDVSPERVHPEYPRPTMARTDWLSLNGLWQFAHAKQGEEPPLGRELGRQILVPFPVESALSGVKEPAERVWYRRTFARRPAWAGKRILLHFGASNWETTVWVNGKAFEPHRGGYDGFTLDITEALKGDGPQEIVVGVWNPIDAGPQPRGKQVRRPHGIWYTASTGIWQTVWLEPVPEASIESLKIVPDLDTESVRVTARVRGTIEPQFKVHLKAKVSEGGVAVGDPGKEIKLPIPRAQPWSPETPVLYDLRVELRRGNTVVDAVDSYVALRKTSLGKDEKGITRLFLNNKPYFQVGPLDQGFWPDGLYTAPTDEALRYDIEITKKLGFNMARKHVKVEPERWYYWCDKLGLLVWQDMPSGDAHVAPGRGQITRTLESARTFERELKRMIEGRGNHPSIVMWVPFNEGWGQYDTIRITEMVKRLDPSRLVNNASGWNDYPVGDVHDIHVYPGPGSPRPEAKRAAVLGEFGGLGLPIKGHLWQDDEKNWGYRVTKDKADLTRKYERLLQRVYRLKDDPGLSAAVYTQTTDVEIEVNGLLTYDRAIVKVDLERAAAANRGDFSRLPELVTLVPTSKEKPQAWRYITEKPADGWEKPDFADASWKQGRGGFGTRMTPGSAVGTEWKTNDIWVRREFTLPDRPLGEVLLSIHHDEDAEVYINGVLGARLRGHTTEYEEAPLSAEARKALRPGKNVLAVHCKQTAGGQYIDVGLVEEKKK